MGPHDSLLFLVQRSRLIQDGIADAQLADVMQRGRHPNQFNILGRQPIPAGFSGQLLQQQRGHTADMEHMRRALLVVVAHHTAEDADHHPVILFPRLRLLGDNGDQPTLLGIQLNGVHHPVIDHLRVKGPANVVRHAHLEGHPRVVVGRIHRDRYHGDILNIVCFIHLRQYGEAVHHRHDHVQQHQRNTRAVLL